MTSEFDEARGPVAEPSIAAPKGLPPELRLDAVADRRLGGLLEGRTPLDLLSDVIDLGENVTVGWISQAIVGHVLRPLGARLMRTFFSWDLELDGPIEGVPRQRLPLRVEVRTCSIAQAWSGAGRRRAPTWSCKPIGDLWDPEALRYVRTSPIRPSDLYIFVLRSGGDPFDADGYETAAVATAELPSTNSLSRTDIERIRNFTALRSLDGLVVVASQVAYRASRSRGAVPPR